MNAWRRNPIEKANDSKQYIVDYFIIGVDRSQLTEAEFLSEPTQIAIFSLKIYIYVFLVFEQTRKITTTLEEIVLSKNRQKSNFTLTYVKIIQIYI